MEKETESGIKGIHVVGLMVGHSIEMQIGCVSSLFKARTHLA
jgi:hypothetical protein